MKIEHLFLNYPFAHAIWYGSPLSFLMNQIVTNCFASWWNTWMDRKSIGVIDQTKIIFMSYVLWQIWKTRNEKFYNNYNAGGTEVLQKIKVAHMKWMQFIKETQEAQPTIVIQEDVHSYE